MPLLQKNKILLIAMCIPTTVIEVIIPINT